VAVTTLHKKTTATDWAVDEFFTENSIQKWQFNWQNFIPLLHSNKFKQIVNDERSFTHVYENYGQFKIMNL